MSQPLKIYAFGSNGSGQLGLGHNEDTSSPEPVLDTSGLIDGTISNIACGGNHTTLLFDKQVLSSTGNNEDGRCFGIPVEQTTRLIACQFAGLRLEQVAATWSATIAVDHESRVWACGTGSFGELGLGENMTVACQPEQIPDFPPPGSSVLKIAACMAHVVAVLSNGEVWGWGKGRKGQLGEPSENVWRPRRIEGIPFAVVDAVCGKDFTCVFGHPSSGKFLVLGLESNDRFELRGPGCPDAVPNWKRVAASWGSIFVLFESGTLKGWGRNDHGQLPPQGLPSLQLFAAGSEHCLALTKSGKVLTWGWGEHGNCGSPVDDNGDVKVRWNEIETPEPAVAVFAGCATSFVVTKPK